MRYVHIATPAFWRKADGSAVDAFTVITTEDVKSGRFVPVDPALKADVLKLLEETPKDVWPLTSEDGLRSIWHVPLDVEV